MLNNEARGGGDAILKTSGQVHLRNSIVAGSGDMLACAGGLDESIGNFSHDGSCALRPGGDPLLADSTGSPSYFPLQDGSPAVDAADEDFCPETDQTGGQRPQGDGCDIGAFESPTASPASAVRQPQSVCSLSDHIMAANTNTAVGGCPAGTSHDIITLTEDITLSEALPAINGTITIEGNGHTISGDGRFRIFEVIGRKLTINNLTLTQARTGGSGGAIQVQNDAELVVNNSVFKNNFVRTVDDISETSYEPGYGGAIATRFFSGRISIHNSLFSFNWAEISGGAIYIDGGSMDIKGSTFSSNSSQAFGGAIEVTQGEVNIENSTFHSNGSTNGGGVSITGGAATMTHLTMLDNTSEVWARGAAVRQSRGSVQLRNSIVAGNSLQPACYGSISLAGNFSEDGTCAATTDGDPELEELSGEPGYFPPVEGSPVVDAADPAFCLATDQAGKRRPIGAGCDIGAIEWGPRAKQKRFQSLATRHRQRAV